MKQLKALFIILTAFAANHVMADEAQDAKMPKSPNVSNPLRLFALPLNAQVALPPVPHLLPLPHALAKKFITQPAPLCHSIGVAGAPKRRQRRLEASYGSGEHCAKPCHQRQMLCLLRHLRQLLRRRLLAAIHFMAGK